MNLARIAQLGIVCSVVLNSSCKPTDDKPTTAPEAQTTLKIGVDRAMEGLAAAEYLRAAFENQSPLRWDLVYDTSKKLADRAIAGEFDLILLASEVDLKRLETEGIALRSATWAHEEFVFIGPPDDPMGTHGSHTTAELMRNLQRSSYLMLKPKEGTAEHVRYFEVLRSSGDPQESGSFIKTDLDGVALVKRSVADRAFAIARRSAVIQAARDGTPPLRVYHEGTPEMVLRLRAVEIHPQRTKRARHPELFDFLMGKEGQNIADKFGSQSFGYPIYGPGDPPAGQGARVPKKE